MKNTTRSLLVALGTWCCLHATTSVTLHGTVHAQPLLEDSNADGAVSVLAFGDSITFGIGDGIAPGADVSSVPLRSAAGYPSRLQTLAGVAVVNAGVPGEFFLDEGVQRFAQRAASSTADVLLLMEGANDSGVRASTEEYSSGIQKVINIAHALGKKLVLLTLPTPCCGHDGRQPITRAYSSALRHRVQLNQVQLTDLELVWETSCANKSQCELYNLPEGLHPNTKGYDVMAQAVAATLVGVDVFAIDGPAQLEAALGLAPGTVLVKPLS